MSSDRRWADVAGARCWGEVTKWDGRNHISVNTGKRSDHQSLYLTAGGAWILEHWSARHGVVGRWEVIEPEAARWLIRNEHRLPAELESIASPREAGAVR